MLSSSYKTIIISINIISTNIDVPLLVFFRTTAVSRFSIFFASSFFSASLVFPVTSVSELTSFNSENFSDFCDNWARGSNCLEVDGFGSTVDSIFVYTYFTCT